MLSPVHSLEIRCVIRVTQLLCLHTALHCGIYVDKDVTNRYNLLTKQTVPLMYDILQGLLQKATVQTGDL